MILTRISKFIFSFLILGLLFSWYSVSYAITSEPCCTVNDQEPSLHITCDVLDGTHGFNVFNSTTEAYITNWNCGTDYFDFTPYRNMFETSGDYRFVETSEVDISYSSLSNALNSPNYVSDFTLTYQIITPPDESIPFVQSSGFYTILAFRVFMVLLAIILIGVLFKTLRNL